jgi:hypothetical protein
MFYSTGFVMADFSIDTLALSVAENPVAENPVTENPVTENPGKVTDQQAVITQNRKADHLRVCLEEDVQSHQTTGLEHYRFRHC